MAAFCMFCGAAILVLDCLEELILKVEVKVWGKTLNCLWKKKRMGFKNVMKATARFGHSLTIYGEREEAMTQGRSGGQNESTVNSDRMRAGVVCFLEKRVQLWICEVKIDSPFPSVRSVPDPQLTLEKGRNCSADNTSQWSFFPSEKQVETVLELCSGQLANMFISRFLGLTFTADSVTFFHCCCVSTAPLSALVLLVVLNSHKFFYCCFG